MQASVGYRTSFEARHSLVAPGHSYACGHTYEVEVVAEGPIEPGTGRVRGIDALLDTLKRVAAELANRDIDKMLPGTIASNEGIAMWFLDRIASVVPAVVQVSVRSGWQEQATVRRTVR